MQKVKYKVGKHEYIGLVPCGAIVDVYIVESSEDANDVLIYMPKKTKWVLDDESGMDSGCGCLSLASYNIVKEYYQCMADGYINLSSKSAAKYEKMIKNERSIQKVG